MTDPRHNPKAWVDKAEEDLRAAKILLDSDSRVFGVCGFHCQQAAEKYLKAVLVNEGIEPPRIHDLARLLAIVAERTGTDVIGLVVGASWLSMLAVETRYPDGLPSVDVREKAERALAIAERIRHFCRKRLRDDAH